VNFELVYQITFNDTCICLESVAVWSAPESVPAPPIHPVLLGPPTQVPVGPG